ncbi:MAG: MFS transporter [Verrucomicrobiales bacterium]|nr:MFS transporter [Verrucomicrobiales bacterium]MCP5559796.1 MFS transporter [Verrucomicrobiaceae bacterium]
MKRTHWKWIVCGLLMLATMINYMDRVTLSNASVRITEEFQLTEQQYGNLETFFGLAFAAGSLAFGLLSDKLPVYWLYPVVLAGWSVMGMLSGWVHNYQELMLCRVLLGFFEAGHWPCALKTTFAVMDERDRTMGNSILQSGASIGAIITPQIMKVAMTDELGSWRPVFVWVGAVGLVWVLLWLVMMRPKSLRAQEIADRATPSLKPVSIWPILMGRRFWAVALLIMGTQTVWHIFRVWLVKFLQTGRGYSQTAALDFTSAYYIATDVGCFLAGLTSLWLVKKWMVSPHASRRIVYAAGCGLTSLCVLIPKLPQGWILLTVLLLIGAGALAQFPSYYSYVQELSADHVGRLTGLLSMWVWAVTSPLQSLFGWIADRTGSYDMGLVVAGLVPWMGVMAMRLLWDPAVKKIAAA